jgi:hypothetical protein
MAKVEIYDRPMCCSTGVCGPDVDPVLPRFAADLDWLKSAGHEVDRFNLARQPGAFAENDAVREVLACEGVDSLPLVVVDGQIISRAVYPSRQELEAFANGSTDTPPTATPNPLPIAGQSGGCGEGSDCC